MESGLMVNELDWSYITRTKLWSQYLFILEKELLHKHHTHDKLTHFFKCHGVHMRSEEEIQDYISEQRYNDLPYHYFVLCYCDDIYVDVFFLKNKNGDFYITDILGDG